MSFDVWVQLRIMEVLLTWKSAAGALVFRCSSLAQSMSKSEYKEPLQFRDGRVINRHLPQPEALNIEL